MLKIKNKLLAYMARNNPFHEDIFPTETKAVGDFLRAKGLTDMEITAISGCISRHGYNVAIFNIEHYFED